MNLSFDGVLKTRSFDGGGELKTIEKVIRLCTVLIFLSCSCEDICIFHVNFNLV